MSGPLAFPNCLPDRPALRHVYSSTSYTALTIKISNQIINIFINSNSK
jgi:hypothetical protein